MKVILLIPNNNNVFRIMEEWGKFYKNHKVFILVGLAILLVARDLDSLFIPRILFDELNRFALFRNRDLTLWQKVMWTVPYICLHDVALNLPSIIQCHFHLRLEYLAYLSAWLAFSFYLLTLWSYLNRPLIIINTPLKKITASLFIIFLFYGMCPQVFFSMGYVSPILGALSLAILLSDSSKLSWFHHIIDNLLLLFAGLSQGYTNFLAPSFILKSVYYRTISDTLKAINISVTTLIQLYAVIIAEDKSSLVQIRGFSAPLYNRIVQNIYPVCLKPFLGFLEFFKPFWIENLKSNSIILICFGIAYILLVFWLLDHKKIYNNLLLLASFLSVFIGSTHGALNGLLRDRYASLTVFITILFILENLDCSAISTFLTQKKRCSHTHFLFLCSKSIISLCLLILGVTTGLRFHFSPLYSYYYQSPYWIEDIKNYQMHTNYLLTPVARTKIVDLDMKNLIKTIETNKVYNIKDVVTWLDYYQLH